MATKLLIPVVVLKLFRSTFSRLYLGNSTLRVPVGPPEVALKSTSRPTTAPVESVILATCTRKFSAWSVSTNGPVIPSPRLSILIWFMISSRVSVTVTVSSMSSSVTFVSIIIALGLSRPMRSGVNTSANRSLSSGKSAASSRVTAIISSLADFAWNLSVPIAPPRVLSISIIPSSFISASTFAPGPSPNAPATPNVKSSPVADMNKASHT